MTKKLFFVFIKNFHGHQKQPFLPCVYLVQKINLCEKNLSAKNLVVSGLFNKYLFFVFLLVEGVKLSIRLGIEE